MLTITAQPRGKCQHEDRRKEKQQAAVTEAASRPMTQVFSQLNKEDPMRAARKCRDFIVQQVVWIFAIPFFITKHVINSTVNSFIFFFCKSNFIYRNKFTKDSRYNRQYQETNARDIMRVKEKCLVQFMNECNWLYSKELQNVQKDHSGGE